jgi:hypothetical protein
LAGCSIKKRSFDFLKMCGDLLTEILWILLGIFAKLRWMKKPAKKLGSQK